jgi:acetyltransferase
VRTDHKGRGIGTLLMKTLVDHAKRSGIGELFGEILPENRLMIALAQELGFAMTAGVDGAWRHASLRLR